MLDNEDTAIVNRELPADMAKFIQEATVEELKKRIITENGLTIAQEEAIHNLDPNDTTGSMTPEEYLRHLDSRIKSEEDAD